MLYDFRCDCGAECTRNVRVDERNIQLCDCGRVLQNVTKPTCNIVIPESFGVDSAIWEPQNEREREAWKDTAPFKGG